MLKCRQRRLGVPSPSFFFRTPKAAFDFSRIRAQEMEEIGKADSMRTGNRYFLEHGTWSNCWLRMPHWCLRPRGCSAETRHPRQGLARTQLLLALPKHDAKFCSCKEHVSHVWFAQSVQASCLANMLPDPEPRPKLRAVDFDDVLAHTEDSNHGICTAYMWRLHQRGGACDDFGWHMRFFRSSPRIWTHQVPETGVSTQENPHTVFVFKCLLFER